MADCSCRGTNENCTRCDGRGYYTVNSYTEKRAVRETTVRCPYCGTSIPRAEVEAHMRTSHPEEMAVPHRKAESSKRNDVPRHTKRLNVDKNEPRIRTVCPVCGKLMKQEDLAKHWEEKHALPPVPHTHRRCLICEGVFTKEEMDAHTRVCRETLRSRPQRRSKKRKKLPEKRVVCPKCGVQVNEKNLSRHLQNVHYFDTASNTSKQKPRARKGGKQSESKKKTASTPQRRQTPSWMEGQHDDGRKMDVTRPYAHARREHGRFGSHPSHDDYGDESNP